MKKTSGKLSGIWYVGAAILTVALIGICVWTWMVFSPAPTEPPGMESAVNAYVQQKQSGVNNNLSKCSHQVVALQKMDTARTVLFADTQCSFVGVSGIASSGRFPARLVMARTDSGYAVEGYKAVYFGGTEMIAPDWVIARYHRLDD